MTGQELPFVTISHWEAIMADAREVIKSSSLHYLPLLQSEEELVRWNNYSAQNFQWIEETRFHLNGGLSVYVEDQPTPYAFAWGANGPYLEDMSNGAVSPMWQYGPIQNKPIVIANFNAARVPEFQFIRDLTLRTKKAALSTQAFVANENPEIDPPASMLLQPITNGFQHEANTSIVAHMMALIPWSEFFSNVRTWRRSLSSSCSLTLSFSSGIGGRSRSLYCCSKL